LRARGQYQYEVSKLGDEFAAVAFNKLTLGTVTLSFFITNVEVDFT